MIYWQLILVFLKVGTFGFGGGLAIISLLEREVALHGWMTQAEFVDIVAISQVTPGPVGINCATYVGYTATGNIWGSILATSALVAPSIIIMLTLCYLYRKAQQKWRDSAIFHAILRAIRILVVLLIAWATVRLITPASFIDYKSWLIFGITIGCMLLCEWKKNQVTDWLSNPILLLLLAGISGLILYYPA